jgi:hypothetical protein
MSYVCILYLVYLFANEFGGDRLQKILFYNSQIKMRSQNLGRERE